MKSVSVGEAKNNLPVLLHFVEEKKETIQITRHGKPVGRIVPETEESSKSKYFMKSLQDWRTKNADVLSLFTNEEIDNIFQHDKTIEEDVRHPEDFEW